MKKIYLFVLFLCTSLFVVHAQELLTNGSFETWTNGTGFPDGWGTVKSDGTDWIAKSSSARTGSNALQLICTETASTDIRSFSSPLFNIAPGEYLVEFYLKGKGRIRNISFTKGSETPNEALGNRILATSNILNGVVQVSAWTKYQAYVVIPENNNWSEVRMHIGFNNTEAAGSADAFLIDDISVKIAPTPAVPVAFYLKNLPIPRIGTDSDVDIINDLKADGFLVVEVDCSGYPSGSPALENRLLDFHIDVPNYLPAHTPSGVTPDLKTIFYVPAGYRVARDIVVWNIKDYGAENILNYVMTVYNTEVVNEYKIPQVTTPDQMVDKKGMPIDYNLRMDIIYPSGTPAQKVPLLLNYSSNSPRFAPFSPETSGRLEVRRRAIYPLGFLSTGYAFVNIDHCYIPLSRSDKFNYGYYDRYTLDSYNGVAYVTSALRYIQSQLDTYNLNGKIGTMGISKASYASVVAANVHNDVMSEYSSAHGATNPNQPYQGYRSHVDVAYAAAGAGTTRTSRIVDEDTSPMITSIGRDDSYNHWPLYPAAITPLINAGIIRLDMWMEEMGHTYPVSGTDYVTGIDRYPLFKTFFDNFLKPEDHVNPEVYYILPKENTSTVYPDGTFRSLLPDKVLPPLKGISPMDQITVRFLSSMNTGTISQYLKVIDVASSTEILGTWAPSMKNTCFKFTPGTALEVGLSYKVQVLENAEDVDGNKLQSGVERIFSVTEAPPGVQYGPNLMTNGDMENWNKTGGVFDILPVGYVRGQTATGTWAEHADGRGGTGNAIKLKQPSTDNGQHRRLDFPVLKNITPGKYHFSAYFKGVGTIRWVKLSKGSSYDGTSGTNFITTTDIALGAEEWQEVTCDIIITEESDYHLSMSFFKTIDADNPFLIDDISFRKIMEESSVNGNYIPNGDMEEWLEIAGNYVDLPDGFVRGVGTNAWTEHAEGRGEFGNAIRLIQPSTSDGNHRRLDFPVVTDLPPGDYIFSAFFKGVGTIRWVKLSKGNAYDGGPGAVSNFITTTDINSSEEWVEVKQKITITERSSYHFSMSFFKTIEETKPFLIDDVSLTAYEGSSLPSVKMSRLNIYAGNQSIVIGERMPYTIYSVSGQLITSGNNTGDRVEIFVRPGLYIVKAGNQAKKIFVK